MLAPALVLSSLAFAAPAPAPAAPAVAVLYFDFQGKKPELEVLRKGLAQMLISDLSSGTGYQLVERDRLEEVLAELKLGQSKKLDPASAAKVGKLLGAKYLVLGSYFELMDALRIDARVVEVETGKVIRSVGGHGLPDDFFALEQRLAQELGVILETQLPPASAGSPPKKKPAPAKPKKLGLATAVKYSRALDAKDRKDPATAKKEMKAVLEEQPDFALAQLDLNALVQ